MDDKEDQNTSPKPPLPVSNPAPLNTYPRIRRRKPNMSKIKLTQIHEKSPEPEHKTGHELVLYDKSGDSREPRSRKRKKDAFSVFYDSTETKSPAMELAEEFRANLESAYPSFAKTLVRSNVTVGFWMHLPMRFCKMHLPKNDTTIFLENESGEEYILNYIAERTALSGGWKAFCAANNLHEGDVLVFHLVKPSRFKVYIVKGNGSSQGDGEFGIPNSGANGKEIISEPAEKDVKGSKKAELLELLPVGHQEENNQENGLIAEENNKGYVANQSENESEDRASETLRVIKLSGSTVDFNNVKGIENFSILLNGFSIDSELSEHHRTRYYELCRSQKSFLHSNLLNSINHNLAVEIIIGTVDISEGIKSSKLSSSQADYGVWDKTLKGFELFGMKVGFLRERLSRLMSLALESEEAMESECREVRLEQVRVDEEMKSLELRLLKLKETRERLDDEMEILKENAEKHEHMFQEAVNAPW
ncbi:B3 DOMAIN-CONTAINING PROTEIN-RELATED [Salix purpurea]|uniref:B3 DOMAIN-CONTAINING PROTEIN-RELATED n=1 Tax=Salix purpurea TaxID=77065 RepID=A0A9Q0PQT1_SALPP|nr:B3 DOMAIN-CONTAINING PROTEIN-RELATED [Salix purpurea]